MADTIGQASIQIIADTSKFKTDLDKQLRGQLQNAQRGVSRSMDQLGDTVKTGMDRASRTVGTTKFQLPEPDSRGFLSSVSNSAANAGLRGAQALGRTLVKGVSSVAGEAADVMRTTLVGGAVVIGGAVSTALVTGFRRFTTIQDATQSLTITLGSAADAATLLSKVLDVVKGTPFNLDQFAHGAQVLNAMGVAADKIPNILTAIGEASATQGSQANEFAQRLFITFGQISAQGRIMGEDLLQLSGTGVNALAILGNHFGKSAQDMQKMVSEGAVPAQEAIDALANGIVNGTTGIAGTTVKLGGTMKALGNTLSGSKENLGAAVARFGATIITPFKDLLTSGFQSATAIFDSFGAEFKRIFTNIAASPLIKNILDLLLKLPTEVAPLIDKFKEFSGVLGALGGAGLGAALGSIKGALGPLGALLPELNPVVGAIAGIVLGSKDLRAEFGKLFKSIAPILQSLGKQLAPVLEALIGSFTPLLKVVGDLAGQLIGAFAPVLVTLGKELIPIVRIIADVGKQLLTALGPAIVTVVQTLGTVFHNLGPVIQIIAGIVDRLLSKAFKILVPVIEQVVAILGPVLTQILQKLSPVIEQIGNVLADQFLEVFKELAPQLPELAKAFGQMALALTDLLVALLPVLIPLIKLAAALDAFSIRIWTTALILADKALAGLAETLAKVLAPIVQFVVAVGSKAVEGLKAFIDWITRPRQALEDLWKALQTVGKAIGDFFEGLPGKVSAALTPLARLIGGFFERLPGIIGRALAGAGEAVIGFFAGLPHAIDHFMASIPGRIGDIGIQIAETLQRVAPSILAFFSRLPGIVGRAIVAVIAQLARFDVAVLKAFADVPGIVARAMKALAGAVVDAIPEILGFFVKLPGQIVRTFSRLEDDLGTIGTKVFKALVDAMTKALPKLLAFMVTVAPKVLAALTNLPALVVGLFARLFPETTAMLGRTVGTLLSFFGGLAGRVLVFLANLPAQIFAFFFTLPGKMVDGLAAALPVLGRWFLTFEVFIGQQLIRAAQVVFNWAISIPGIIVRGIQSALGVLISWAVAFGPWLVQNLARGASALLSFGIQIPAKILQGILSGIGAISHFATGFMSTLVSWLGSGASALVGFGKSIIDKIIQGIKSAPGAIIDAVRSLIPGPLKSIVSHVPGLGSLLGGHAIGGPVLPGQTFLVGERGRELFVPTAPGVIIPNYLTEGLLRAARAGQLDAPGRADGAGSVALTTTAPTINLTINVAGVTPADAGLVAARIAPQVKAAVQAAVRANS